MTNRLENVLAQLSRDVQWSGGECRNALIPHAFGEDYRAVVRLHDGLIALEGGLRIFGVSESLLPDVASWNAASGWRSAYRSLADGLHFFAEDAFGDQFAIDSGRVVRFHAETAEREPLCDSVLDWLARILRDPESELSLPVIRRWRRLGNKLKPDHHLCPTYPFVLKGSRDRTLHALDRYESMQFKGNFAWQIRGLPDGSKIKVVVKDR